MLGHARRGRSELKKACAAKRKVLKVMAKEAKVRAVAAKREADQAEQEAEAMKRKVNKYRRAQKRLQSARAVQRHIDELACLLAPAPHAKGAVIVDNRALDFS